ncbi:hypothetical protein BOX15_Mlig022026g1, partial [Macrostomum lignano]
AQIKPQPLPMTSQPGLYIITGAGRGFGRTLTLALAEDAAPGSRFILIGRNSEALDLVAAAIAELRNASDEIETRTVSLDLGQANADAIESALQEATKSPLLGTYAPPFGLLVHNAGTLGIYGQKSDCLTDKAALDEHWSVNITSVLLLNAYCLKLSIVNQWWIVNVSSLCAVQPFKSMAVYCASKAARLMLFRTLAAERPDLSLLSYGPGPLDTDMQAQLIESADPESRAMWQDLRERLLPPAQSGLILVRMLRRGGFGTTAGGEHQQVDVYDVMDELLQPPTPPTPATSEQAD